jgi:hypothetical protein
MVFAREASDNLTSLVKKIDDATAKNSKAGMKSFVCFLSDDESLEGKLKALSSKEGIKNTPFAIDNTAGPKAYKVAKDADVTVIFYKNKKVAANHAFKKGELKGTDIDKIVADLSKILPAN